MKEVMSEIKNEMDKKDMKQKYVADKIKCKNLSNNLNGKEQMGFIMFIRLVETVCDHYTDNRRRNLIKRFILASRDENVRVALEWCSQTGNSELKNIAIKKCKKINPHHKQIADIYDLFDRRNESRINRIDFNREMDEIRNTTVSRSETKLLLNIGKLYYYSDSGNYRGILDEESYLETNILKSEYLATSLRLRILERKATALIKYENDLVQATKILEEILQKGEDFAFSLINALSLMSEVHLMKDANLAAYYIRKAIKLCERISQDTKRYSLQKRQLESTHDFIMLYHCKLNEKLYLNSKPELIHFLIRRGSKEDLARATSLLKELEKENGKLTPFQLYYKALITGEKHYLIQSQREFHRGGDFFYSQIPSKLL